MLKKKKKKKINFKGERFQYNLQKCSCHSKMLKTVLVERKLEFCESGWSRGLHSKVDSYRNMFNGHAFSTCEVI